MNARGTRRPRGGGGRGPKVRRGGGRGSKGKSCLLLLIVGSGLMIVSGAAGLAVAWAVTR